MNELIAVLILAIVQGVTEWLPVSSQGHLVIAEYLLGYSGGLLLEVTLHFGTLMAVFVYFGREITEMLEDILRLKWKTEKARFFWLVILATIPGVIFGFLIRDYFEQIFSGFVILALSFAITGATLMIASFQLTSRKELNWKIALVIGCAQAIAIVPAISRSGATIAAALLLGLKEKDALKFSFIMSIPIIIGANVLTLGFGSEPLPQVFLWATLFCFVVALGAIHILYKYVLTSRKNLRWFAAYCFALAVVIMLFFFFG